jgi:hypothetical protein
MSGPKKPLRKGANSGKPGGDPPRPALPPQSSVLTELSIDSPKGNRYRILRTTEKDATDVDKKPPT